MNVDKEFINNNLQENPAKLLLKYSANGKLSEDELDIIRNSILQIECRKRFDKKFPGLWSKHSSFCFPSLLAGEQASHLWVAQYHAFLAKSILKNFDCRLPELPNVTDSSQNNHAILLDMTAGLGLDFICMASKLSESGYRCIAVELDSKKAEVLENNLTVVGLENAQVITDDSIETLHKFTDTSIQLLYVDPARRGADNTRKYDPSECSPDILGNWDMIMRKANFIMVKNSPMLDLHKVLQLFPGAFRIDIVSVKNECKEILVSAKKNGHLEDIFCVDITSSEDYQMPLMKTFHVSGAEWMEEQNNVPFLQFESALNTGFIYEPSATLMKTGAWRELIKKYDSLCKLSKNCHIFYSSEFIHDFPGRVLEIERIVDRAQRKSLKGEALNVVTRNYPVPADSLSKSMKLSGSQDRFLYGVTICENEIPVLIIATKR